MIAAAPFLHVLPTRELSYGGPVKVAEAMVAHLTGAGSSAELFPNHGKKKRFAGFVIGNWWRELPPRIDRCALVHAHGIWAIPTSYAMWSGRRCGRPVVVSLHSMLTRWSLSHRRWKKALYDPLIERANLNAASALHFFNRAELEEARPLGLRAPTFVLPNGIDLCMFKDMPSRAQAETEWPQLEDRIVALFLGRIHPVKALDLLIPALAVVRQQTPELHLVIAGPDEGEYRQRVDQLIERHRLGGAVTFTGPVSGARKLSLLARADLFTLPSYQEGDSVAVKEAMAAGLPLLISTGHRFPEVATKGAGFVAQLTVESIAEVLGCLAADAQLRISMGALARRWVEESFTWSILTHDLRQIYDDVQRGCYSSPRWVDVP